MILPPAKRPCATCPYRRDVPSGIWDASEYRKLPHYDNPTIDQPVGVFLCHQADGRVCAGWVGCHDMPHSLSFRLACAWEDIAPDSADEFLSYESPVPLWSSGEDAAAHGLRDIDEPSEQARKKIHRILDKRRRKS